MNAKAYLIPTTFTKSFYMKGMNGGKHAGMKNDIQEHMIVPIGAKNFTQALRMGAETYHELKSILKKKFGVDKSKVAPYIVGKDAADFLVIGFG